MVKAFVIDYRNPSQVTQLFDDQASMEQALQEYYSAYGNKLPSDKEPPVVYELTNAQLAEVGVILTPFVG